jgi:hypothetical protein
MLVLTRRPGESILIGDHIEVLIVAVDWTELEARCAINVRDDDGNDVPLQHVRTLSGVTVIRTRGDEIPTSDGSPRPRG